MAYISTFGFSPALIVREPPSSGSSVFVSNPPRFRISTSALKKYTPSEYFTFPVLSGCNGGTFHDPSQQRSGSRLAPISDCGDGENKTGWSTLIKASSPSI